MFPINSRHILRFILAQVLLSSFATTLAGEFKAGPGIKSTIPTPLDTKKFAQTALDKDAKSLPEGYLGHSCEAIANTLKKSSPVKGEFETSLEFSARLESMKSAVLYGEVHTGDLMGFSPTATNLKMKYDADREEMNVDFDLGSPQFIYKSDPSSTVIINSEKVSNRSYVAENVFGKKTKVDVEGFNVCAFAGARGSTYFLGGYRKDFDFSVSRAAAIESKGKLRILFVGHVVSPYVGEYHDHKKPTADFPYESYVKGPVVALRLAQIWIFNKETGKILTKVGTLPTDE